MSGNSDIHDLLCDSHFLGKTKGEIEEDKLANFMI